MADLLVLLRPAESFQNALAKKERKLIHLSKSPDHAALWQERGGAKSEEGRERKGRTGQKLTWLGDRIELDDRKQE